MRKIFFRAGSNLLLGLQWIFSFAADTRCIVCSQKTRLIPLCVSCREKYFSLDENGKQRCSVCGKVLVSEKEKCLECRTSPLMVSLDGVKPIFSYRLWNTSLLCRWKLQDERTLSRFFANLLKKFLEEQKKNWGTFVLVPVPPREGKIKERGWDQVCELVKYLELYYGFEVIRPLKRISSVQQKKLDREGRINSIGKSYVLKEGVKNLPEKLCLIDDVITTGSTIESCAKELKKGGAKTVFAVSLFTVDS